MRTTPDNDGRLAVWSVFQFDLGTLRLRKHGLRLRLEQKPAQVLACLLEQPGELVRRDDLVKLLWPEEAHGDFDQRLNKAVHKVRCTLGDQSADPRFIETLSRCGYRFIANVEFVNQNGCSSAEPVASESGQKRFLPLQPNANDSFRAVELPADELRNSPLRGSDYSSDHLEDDAATGGDVAPSLISLFKPKSLFWRIAAGLVLAFALFSVWAKYRATYFPTSYKSIAVLSFANLSGNPADQWLSTAFADWIASDLTAGGSLRAISKIDLAQFETDQGLRDFDRISPNVLARMSHNLGADLVFSGSYASSGTDNQSRIRLDLYAHDAHTGRLIFSVNATGSREEVFDLATSAGIQLRRKLRLGPLDASGLSSMRAMLPSNPDAARFYAEGTEEIERFDPVDARVLLERAVALEPAHALSHAVLSTAYTMLGSSAEARTEARRALDFSGALAAEQRLLVEGQFDEANYKWDRAVEVYSRLFQLFPDSAENGIRLARAEVRDGKPLVALDTLAQLRQSSVASDDEARIDIEEAEAAASVSDFRQERDAAGRAADRARQSSATQLLARAEEEQGEALRAMGSLSEAQALWKDAEARYTAIGDRSAVARLLIDKGRVQWQQGDPAAAEASYNGAVSISQQTGDEGNLGRALTALAQVRMYYVSWAEGNRLCKQALAIFRKTGNKQEEAYTLSIMADILSPSNHAQAIKLYQLSLDLSREVNDRSRTAGRLMDLGIQAMVQGHLDSANEHLLQSLALYSQIGERNRQALQMELLADVRVWQGRLEEADSLSNQAIAILTSVGDAGLLEQSRENLGIVQMEEGRLEDAEATLKLAIEESRNGHNPGGVAIASGQLAEVLLREGKLTAGEAALNEYEAVFQKQPKGRPFVGEHVTERTIVMALIDAAEGKLLQAQNQAIMAVDQAMKADQGSMMMKARLVLGEIELQSADQLSGRRDLEILEADADSKGFGLISREARRLLAHASGRSHANHSESPVVALHRLPKTR